MLHPLLDDKSKITQEGFDVVLSQNKIAILIETIQRNVVTVNQTFCELFDIKQNPHQLIDTSVLSNAKIFSLKFKEHNKFYESIIEPPTNNIENESWILTNGKQILKNVYLNYQNNKLFGYIWSYQLIDDNTNKQLLPSNASASSEKNNLPYEDILNLIPHPIAIFCKEKKFKLVNAAYINSPQKRIWAIGKSIDDWYSYENKNIINAHQRMKQLDAAINKKITTQLEETFFNNKLEKQTYLWQYIPIVKNQTLTYVLEHAIDITQQKIVEEKLHQSTQHLFNVLQHCSDFIIYTNDALQIEFINKSFKDFLNQKKVESLTDAFELKQYELYKKLFSVLLGETKNNDGKISLLTQNGKEKQFKYNLLPNFTVEDGNKGILITLNDITTKETEEAQLIALVKKEKELNELKTTFVNMVSHELRTPLTVISSSAEILDLLLEAGKPKEALQIHTKQIVDEVEKMTAFMQDLLMISKIEAGKLELNKTATNIAQLIQKIIKQQFAPYKDGRTCVVKVKQVERNVFLDANMITHVIQNLLNNAFKYSTLKTAPFIRVSFSKNHYYISIIDQGIGIPLAEINKLFTSFFRASNTSNISGTGIGLMVVKYFTQQHNGEVFVRSQQNKGSIFCLKLPY